MASSPVSSCTGILWFTSQMKARGEAPYCFGRRGTLRGGTEALEKNAQVDNHGSAESPPPGDFTYACIGYSQATAKMNREGALPLCDVGVRFAMLRSAEVKTDEAAASRKAAARDEARASEEPAGAAAAAAAREGRADGGEARDGAAALSALTSSITAEAVYHACERTVVKVSNFWSNALTNYPEKFVAFNGKMCATMGTHVKYLGKIAKKAWAAIPPPF